MTSHAPATKRQAIPNQNQKCDQNPTLSAEFHPGHQVIFLPPRRTAHDSAQHITAHFSSGGSEEFYRTDHEAHWTKNDPVSLLFSSDPVNNLLIYVTGVAGVGRAPTGSFSPNQ